MTVLLERRGLKTLRSKHREADLAVKTIYFFDMDDTLIRQPHKEAGMAAYERATGKPWPYKRWWSVPESLLPPFKPNPKPAIKGAYLRAKNDVHGYVVIMTGRVNTPGMRKAVSLVLKNAGFGGHTHGDNLILKNVNTRDTAAWKKKVMRGFTRRFPNVTTIRTWDDRGDHVEKFQQHIKDLGREGVVTHVTEAEKLLDEGVRDALAWMRDKATGRFAGLKGFFSGSPTKQDDQAKKASVASVGKALKKHVKGKEPEDAPKGLVQRVKGLFARKYQGLVDKVGPKHAKVALGLLVLAAPVPVPGASPLAMALYVGGVRWAKSIGLGEDLIQLYQVGNRTLYERIVESYPNRARGQAQQHPVPTNSEPDTSSQEDGVEGPMANPLPGNTNLKTVRRAAGSRAHQRLRPPRPPR